MVEASSDIVVDFFQTIICNKNAVVRGRSCNCQRMIGYPPQPIILAITATAAEQENQWKTGWTYTTKWPRLTPSQPQAQEAGMHAYLQVVAFTDQSRGKTIREKTCPDHDALNRR